MLPHKYLCMLLACLACTSLIAQSTSNKMLDSLSAVVTQKLQAQEHEQAYLLTDKSYYNAGDYVWFKAYLLNSLSHKLSAASSFVFIDVVDDNDVVQKHMILDAANGSLHSRIRLPETLKPGNYLIRAYTQNMLESDSLYAAIKPLYIIGATGSAMHKKTTELDAGNIQPVVEFYPEGGNIITGINSVVAIKATLNGKPLATDIIIKDNRDTTITKLTTNAQGLGKLEFEPSGFRHYHATIIEEGKSFDYPLPPFDYFLGQLSIKKEQYNYKLRVMLGDSIYRKDAPTYLIGISKDSTVFGSVGQGQYETTINEDKLPNGITTFYLFDKNGKALSARSVYVDNNNPKVVISTDKNIYAKHEKVTLNFSIKDATNQPLPSIVSIAVADSVFNINTACNNIAGTALSQLAFRLLTCAAAEEQDLVMLTQNSAIDNTLPSIANAKTVAIDSFFYIKGKVAASKNNEPKIVSLIAGASDMFDIDTTDTQGKFRFALNSYADSTPVAIEVKDLNNHSLQADVMLDTLTYPSFKTPLALKQNFDDAQPAAFNSINAYYKKHYTETTDALPPVKVNDTKTNKGFDESKRVNPFSPVIYGDALNGRTSVDNLILRVSGFTLINGFLINRGLNAIRAPGPESEPLVLVDGAPVALSADVSAGNMSPVLSYLKTLNPQDIDFIEVLKDGSASNYGVRSGNGVILINLSNKGHNFKASANNKMHIFYLNGVSKPALFPATVYDEKANKTEHAFDGRSTLLWSGNYLTENASNATVTFYTGDVSATYTVTISGVTNRGDLVYATASFRVK